MADDEKGPLTLKGLKYGFLNDVSDTGMDNSTDRRRSNGTDFLRSAVQANYSRRALEKVDVFTGIVCALGPKSPLAVSNKDSVLAASAVGWDPGKPNHEKAQMVYKVYIPEIECRPAPTGWSDPVIATYYDVYSILGVAKSWFGKPEVGSIVTVRFDNINNFEGPRIIEVGEIIEFINQIPGDLAAAFAGGGAGAAGAGGALGSSGASGFAPGEPSPRRMRHQGCEGEGAIIYIGDSQQAGAGTFGGKLRKYLKDQGVPLVIDMSKSGRGLINGGAGVLTSPQLKKQLESKLSAAKPKYAIIGLGGNDAGYGSRTVGAWKPKFEELLQILRNAGVEKIIWIGVSKPLLPDKNKLKTNDGYGQYGGGVEAQDRRDTMRNTQKSVLASYPEVTYIDSMQYTKNLHTSDGVHYTGTPSYTTWFNAAMAGDLKAPINEMIQAVKTECEAYSQSAAAAAAEEELANEAPCPGVGPIPRAGPDDPYPHRMSDAARSKKRKAEGLVPKLYNDPKGYCTIGIGHLIQGGDVSPKQSPPWKGYCSEAKKRGIIPAKWLKGGIPADGRNTRAPTRTITDAQAEALFIQDVEVREKALVRRLKKANNVKVTQNQFDALMSAVYNAGGGAVNKFIIKPYLAKGDFKGAACAFTVRGQMGYWYEGDKNYNLGLANLREKERRQFASV